MRERYRTPAVQFYALKIKNSSRQDLLDDIAAAPLREADRSFLLDCIDGYSYKQLAGKYHKSVSRVAQWKRALFEAMCRYYSVCT